MMQSKSLLTPKPKTIDRRLQVFLLFCMTVFAILISRLWSIQILQQSFYKERAERNYFRNVPIQSMRGKILDRDGEILAMDEPYWDVYLPIRIKDATRCVDETIEKSIQLLSEILEMPTDTLKRNYKVNNPDYRYKHFRVPVAKQIDYNRYVAVRERRVEFPIEAMVFYRKVYKRKYPNGSLAAHVIGRAGPINFHELETRKELGYTQNDVIGKSGIEKQYESYLRGKDGLNRVMVDKSQIQHGQAWEIEPSVPGMNIMLSIDANLQREAENILGASRGAIIVADPNDNSILVLASSPRFDPNLYNEKFREYNFDRDNPLYHRAIRSQYAPGSIMKPFYCAALLEELNTPVSATVYCPGHVLIYGQDKKCHIWHDYHRGHGAMNMIQAVQLSCDCYFYKMVGQELKMNRLFPWLVNFGFKGPTGIDLPGERFNYPLPTPNTVSPGEMINLSIGQGSLALSPLQISTGLCALVNNGALYQPRVAKCVVSPTDREEIYTFDPVEVRKIEAKPSTWETCHKAMWEVVNTDRGTGRRVRNEEFVLAGKTGTAEVGGGREPHAWFVCYGPFENPEIVVTVLVENSGHGGEIASPMAMKMIEAYQRDKNKDPV